jgi:hypothetical protein
MPRLPRLRAEVLMDLEKQLRFAPGEALRRDIERAEALAADVDAEQAYPLAWVVYRITGYRADAPDTLIRGAALLEDLSALVERLSAAAKLKFEELERGAFLTIEDLQERWSVSRSTINRHRRRGLVARRVREREGADRLVFARRVVEAHEAAQGTTLRRAAGFSRIAGDERTRIEAMAGEHAAAGRSLNEAAALIAQEVGRSHEGVRQVLRRHDERAALFGEPGPLSDRERRLISRAAARGLEASEIGARLERPDESIRRAIDRGRAETLLRIDRSGALVAPDSVAARVDDGAWLAGVLGASGAVEGLHTEPSRDLVALIEWARGPDVPDASTTAPRLTAYHALRVRAGRMIRGLDSSTPSPAAMDRAETDLRWAALLKVQIVRGYLPTILRVAEDSLGAPVDRLKQREAVEVLRTGIASASAVIDSHDLSGGPLEPPLGVRVASALARRSNHGGSGKARPRVLTGVALPDWAGMVAPRFASLLPRAGLTRGASRVTEEARAMLEERFGLAGGAPSTLEEIAARRAVKPMHVARKLRRAIREALAAGRED